MEGVTLLNCDADGVKFLFDVLEDIKTVLEEESPRSAEIVGIGAVKSVLSRVLARHRRSSDDTGAYESRSLSKREYDVGDTDGPDGEDWEFESLCKWILNQVQAAGLEGEKCRTIIDKLEARCGLADAATAKETFSQARPDNSTMIKAVEGGCNRCNISLLPVELLQHVFRLASPPHIWIRAPLVLSHVNSHFRTIALDTPSLWTAVDDSLPFPILELYVARSRNKPLDVVTGVDHIYHESDRLEDNWIDFLNMGSSRVGQMTIAAYNPQLITKWAQRLKGLIFTTLTKMTVCVMKYATNTAACPIWAGFPCLRDLSIEGCWSLGWVGPGDPFPQTLRSLRLTRAHDICPKTLIEALCGVLGLVSLSMEDCALDPDEPVPPTTSRVTLDFLEGLEFSSIKVTDMHVILLLVSPPNLSSLSITSPGPSDGITDFLTTFAAELPQLSCLSIFGLNLELLELNMVLDELTKLTHLHLRASDVNEDDLAFLGNETTHFSRLTLTMS